MLKMEKMVGKGLLCDVIFLNCGHLDQKENYKITLQSCIFVQRKQRITEK